MAVIYDFRNYHTPRVLRSFSQQTGGVARQLYALGGRLDHMNACFANMQKAQRAFASQLGTYLLELEKAGEFARLCSAACELNSIEKMIAKRDNIIRDRLKT